MMPVEEVSPGHEEGNTCKQFQTKTNHKSRLQQEYKAKHHGFGMSAEYILCRFRASFFTTLEAECIHVPKHILWRKISRPSQYIWSYSIDLANNYSDITIMIIGVLVQPGISMTNVIQASACYENAAAVSLLLTFIMLRAT